MNECNYFKCINISSDNICNISKEPCIAEWTGCIAFYGICRTCKDAKDCEFFRSPKQHFKYDTPNNIFSETPNSNLIKNKYPAVNDIPYAYMDGSYNSQKKLYGYGGFIVDGYGRHFLQGRGNDKELIGMRNVAGEIEGARAAIQYAIDHNYTQLLIYYDFLGIENWAIGKWSANKIGTIRYKEFCQSCSVKLLFKHTKSHSGIEGNDIADKLAKQAVYLL